MILPHNASWNSYIPKTNKVIMIRPIPRHNPERQLLAYPQYGEFGYEEPVGKKHLSGKTSAIHKLIFNQEPEYLNRQIYNQMKLGLKRTDQDASREGQEYYSNQSSRYRDDGARPRDRVNRSVDLQQYINEKPNKYTYDLTQSRQIQKNGSSVRKNYKRMDSLDQVINPYKSSQTKNPFDNLLMIDKQNMGMMRERSDNTSNRNTLNRQQEMPVLTRSRNPTFLNSLL